LTLNLLYSILLDNLAVLQELRISGDNQFRPGDLYHPDFFQGHLAFVNVSVHITLSSIISHASVSGGSQG